MSSALLRFPNFLEWVYVTLIARSFNIHAFARHHRVPTMCRELLCEVSTQPKTTNEKLCPCELAFSLEETRSEEGGGGRGGGGRGEVVTATAVEVT